MNKKKNTDSKPSPTADFRRQAEQRLRDKDPMLAQHMAETDVRAVVHELQVHQIELEMQNEELQRARRAAEEASDKYQDLFDFAPVGYFLLDQQGQILEVNLAGAALLGLDRSTAVKQRLEQFVAMKHRAAFADFCRRALTTDAKQTCQIELQCQKQRRCALLEGILSNDGEGNRFFRVTVADVTERERIDDAQTFLLQCGRPGSGEGFFQTLAQYLSQSLAMDYVCIDQLVGDGLTAQTVAVYNDGKFDDNVAYALKDTPCGDTVGKTICCFPKDVCQLFPTDAALRQLKAESYVGTTLWSFDGKPIGLIAIIGRKPLAQPLLAESVLKLVAIRAAGELERKEAEDAVQKAHDRLSAVLESITDAFFSLDRDFRFTYVNREAEKVFRMTRQEVLGRNLWDLFPEAVGSTFQCEYERAMAENTTVYFEEFYPPFNQWYSVHAYPSRGGLLVYFLDITARKRAEEALKAAKDDAEQAKALAEEANRAKDHFLAVLSHELRTPLTPVVMGVSMLQQRPDLDPEMREMLEMVRRNVELEAHLIDDLLDVTRIARGKIELKRSPVELSTVIQAAVEVCKPDIEARGLEFGVDWGPGAPYWVEADAPRLQQVFWNLLRNAIKFTPHGGCVGICCRPNEDHVSVEVNDSGIGIDPGSLFRVFNAFEQVEQAITRQFGGLGLGLAISKTLVEMHGGTISAHSEGKNKGTTFRIRLPLCAPARQPEAPPAAAPPQSAVRPLHILLVDDHPVTAKMIRMVLALDGHVVEMAGDVATALEQAGQQNFDLLVSDLGLPDGSGHDLMRRLRERGHKFPGIALSGYGQEEDIQRSYEAGFTAHLTKPATREAVVEAIASVTAGEMRATLAEPATEPRA